MSVRYKDKNGKWTIGSHAVQTKIIDVADNFKSDNVEGALRELAEKSTGDLTDLKSTVQANSKLISNLNNNMTKAQEDIEWLKVNGGGGGGTAVPTIKSDFENTSIDKGIDVIIPLFFSSPNQGSGTAYILVNNIEVDTTGVSQGNNNVRVKAQYLTTTENKIGIYVKDRAGIVSNQLSWTVIAGGIELTTTFDYESDYGITGSIRIPYTIDTGITNSEITLHMNVDGQTTTYTGSNGYNYIEVVAANLGLGTHTVKMWATVDKYVSKTLSFNLVIVSTDTLYLSSTFENGSKFDYGTPIVFNYRLSKISSEEYKVFIKVDGQTIKTQTVTIGSYYWTTTDLSVGPHVITIQAVSLDYSEDVSIDLDVVIEESEYMPVEDYTLGLICDLNAYGKSNEDDNVEIWKDASGNGNNAKLINFNFSTNGFVNNTLVCDNDAYVVIPWSPWERNAITGSTIDIIYRPINSGIEECRVIDYTQIIDDLSENEIKPFKGLFADTRQAIVSSSASGSSAGKITLDDDRDEIHLTWVLDRENKFMKVFIDGVLSRIMYLSDSGSGVNSKYEDFSLSEHIYLNSTKGLNCGTNDIKRFRVWDHALTSDQVLKNHIASIRDLDKQKELYKFNYENNTLPKMYLTGDTTNMTAAQTVPMKIEYVSPNEEKYGASFNTGIQNNLVRIQGTSSLQYVRHNYTIFLKDEYGVDMYYNPYGKGSVADYVFCLKADYIESSHANNTGMAKFVNDCVYSTKLPTQLENENCRSTINGFPIEVYMNGEYLGVYNFNHDRYSVKSYGYDYNKYPNMLVYEINSNSNTSAGAFYRYGDNAESSANVTELEYYKRDFNLIYGNRTSDSDTYSEIKSLVEWVSVAEQDLFREMIGEHFNKEYLFRYFLVVLMIGGVDSLGKNLKITTFDGKIWYPTFYDLDTILGIDNSGYLTIEPDVEIESGSFNTSNSNLWSKVWNYFNNELKEEWKKMRQGNFTLDNLMKYIYEEQISKIPAKLYNEDAQVKYLDFGSLYTYCCHGSKEHLITRWLKERIAYVDSMLGYFTSQDDQVTIRMNKTGYVEFSVTPYIPLYFSVKWSNATGGTQTFKLKRGETKTFYYNSTTSTDQEVIIYHAQYIKKLENLSNLNPSSCILANAKKLTNVEIHSSKLYNINVTNNKFLRRLDLRNCEALGTVTATGSSLDITQCKYLQYVDVYNTNLTEIQLNNSGGSLTEIYYPKTIQSIRLIKQKLLQTVGLPYGNQGNEIPTSLYTVNIEECPSINKLNTSEDSNINNSFASMIYCNNLTLRNSLDLTELNFRGFHRLKSVTLENMYNLENLGFDDLLPVGEVSTLKYMGISNCTKLKDITFNCTSNDYEITLANDAILNFGKASSLKSITSNCVLKGIKTLIVPTGLESMFFTNEYGTGYSSIKNIWSSIVCSVDTAGATPIATHIDSTFEGIDFAGMNLKNIDLGALVNIPKAINFKLNPTTVNPNFNKNRDGDQYPYLQPEGTLDLSNYTESLAKFFDGVDLDKLQIVCTNNLPQTDLSYCFYNSTFSNLKSIKCLLSMVSNINNLDYCFYQTTIENLDILSEINMATNSTMNYTFAECPNITSISAITIPRSVTSVNGLFSRCPITTVNNLTVNVSGSMSGIFEGCNKLTTINGFRIPNVASAANTFNGCSRLNALLNFALPNTCTDVSNLFNGCYELTTLSDLIFSEMITKGDNWHPPYLESVSNLTIKTDKVKFTGIETLKIVANTSISGDDLSDLFNGCINLQNPTNFNVNAKQSLARAFKNCVKFTKLPINTISDTITNIDEMLLGCELITDISDMVFGNGITSATDWIHSDITTANNITIKSNMIKFRNYINLISCDNLTITSDVTSLEYLFRGCVKLQILSMSNKCNTSNVNNMSFTFEECNTLTAINNMNTLNFEKVTSMRSLLANCNSLSVFPLDVIPDSVTDITRLIYGCKNLLSLDNLVIGNGINNYSEWLGGYGNNRCNVKSISNITVKNNLNLFKGYKILETVENIQRPNSTDWASFFEECTKLKNDIVFPNDTTDVTNCFKNCTSMTHIHSNWNNNYDNEINSADCYVGCTSITHIDDENVIAYEGDLGLDYVPTIWGGNGFDEIADYCGVYEVEIPSDNYEFVCTGHLSSDTMNSVQGVSNRISWGDGVTDIEVKNGSAHIYSKAGKYYIKGNIVNGKDGVPFKNIITKVLKHPKYINNKSWSGWCNATKLVYMDISNFEGRKDRDTNLNNLFSGCSLLTQSNIIGLDTLIQNWVTNITGIFNNCSSLTTLDISQWDTSNVNNMNSMFSGCTNLKTIIGIEKLVTEKVNNIYNMFHSCSSLTTLDISQWDTSNVISMLNTFYGCINLKTIIGIEYLAVGNVENFENTFFKCSSLTSLDLHLWDISRATKLYSTFRECTGLESLNVEGWDISNVTSMHSMFMNIPNIEVLDLSSWRDNSDHKVTKDCTNMFLYNMSSEDVTLLDTVILPSISISSMSNMFQSNKNLVTIDMSNIDTSLCNSMRQTFKECSKLTDIIGLEKLNTSKVTDMLSIFDGCSSLSTFPIENWDTSKVVNMQYAFSRCINFNNDAFNIFKSLNLTQVKYLENCFSNITNPMFTQADFSTTSMPQLLKFKSIFLGSKYITEVAFPNDCPNVEMIGQALQGCDRLVKLDNIDMNWYKNINGYWNLILFAYMHSGGYSSEIEITFLNKLTRETSEKWFTSMTYVNSSVYGILNKITVDSFEKMFRDNLETYTDGEEAILKLSPIVLSKLSPEQIAIATNKGWTLIAA